MSLDLEYVDNNQSPDFIATNNDRTEDEQADFSNVSGIDRRKSPIKTLFTEGENSLDLNNNDPNIMRPSTFRGNNDSGKIEVRFEKEKV